MKNIAEKVRNPLLYLPKEQVEKYVEIDKSMNPEDLVYAKYNLIGISSIFTEATDNDEMHKIINDFNNEINESKRDYLTGQDEQNDYIIKNASVV